MLRGLPLLLFVSEAFGGAVQPLPAHPAGTFVNAVRADSSGYIYIAGESYPGVPSSSTGHAFVGKLSPDGSQIIWWTKLAGSSNDNAQAIALGSDNSVYVTGTTQSQDFPTGRILFRRDDFSERPRPHDACAKHRRRQLRGNRHYLGGQHGYQHSLHCDAPRFDRERRTGADPCLLDEGHFAASADPFWSGDPAS